MSYTELINIDDFAKKEEFNKNRGKVSFYCKDCKKIVDVKRPNPKGYVFICKECNSRKISIGTETGIKTNYKIK